MTPKIPTCTEALELARAALEDDKRAMATRADWLQAGCVIRPSPQAIREPELARWVERVMGAEDLLPDGYARPTAVHNDSDDHAPRGSWVRMSDGSYVSSGWARAEAAALLRAADEAEGAGS